MATSSIKKLKSAIISGSVITKTLDNYVSTNVAQITLPVGQYLIIGKCELQQNGPINFRLSLSNVANSAKAELQTGTSWGTLQVVGYRDVSTDTATVYLSAEQRSGTDGLAISPNLVAINLMGGVISQHTLRALLHRWRHDERDQSPVRQNVYDSMGHHRAVGHNEEVCSQPKRLTIQCVNNNAIKNKSSYFIVKNHFIHSHKLQWRMDVCRSAGRRYHKFSGRGRCVHWHALDNFNAISGRFVHNESCGSPLMSKEVA